MRAAVVSDPSQPPDFTEFAEPVAGAAEVRVTVAAAALSSLARAQAAGRHYSSKTFPLIPGVDGVGRLDDGTRVYFAFPAAPFGSMAETAVIDRALCVPLPDELDDATAAAAGNPGMSSWAALMERAQFEAGESILINGATGVSGRLAVQVAKHLGAGSIVATGRSAAVLETLPSLGADATISLHTTDAEQVETMRREIKERNIGIVLDYLWGQPAANLMSAIAGHGSADAEPRIRFVQIGSSAGQSLAIEAKNLRSSGLELLGSGLGSVSHRDLVASIGAFFRAFVPGGFSIGVETIPLEDVASTWNRPQENNRRVVYTL